MSAARVLHIPLSGRDRRHYAAELRKAETAYRYLLREAEAARAAADLALAEVHRLDCEIWSTRLFLGGPPHRARLIRPKCARRTFRI